MNAVARMGMGQMLVEGGEPDRNMAAAVRMISRAARAGCHIVVLPECLDLGWTHPSAATQACPIPGPRADMLSAAARDSRIYVAAGLTERNGERLYNAAVFISPDGSLLLHHRKINELEIALNLYATGEALAVATTSIGCIGLSICADNFPESLVLGHSLARMGAQLLVSPCAWAVDADHDNTREPYGKLWLDAYTELARLYDMTVVGVSNVGWLTAGPWKGRKCIGCSLAVGPGGKILAQGPYGEAAEELVVVDLQLRRPIGRGTGFADALRQRSRGAESEPPGAFTASAKISTTE